MKTFTHAHDDTFALTIWAYICPEDAFATTMETAPVEAVVHLGTTQDQLANQQVMQFS